MSAPLSKIRSTDGVIALELTKGLADLTAGTCIIANEAKEPIDESGYWLLPDYAGLRKHPIPVPDQTGHRVIWSSQRENMK